MQKDNHGTVELVQRQHVAEHGVHRRLIFCQVVGTSMHDHVRAVIGADDIVNVRGDDDPVGLRLACLRDRMLIERDASEGTNVLAWQTLRTTANRHHGDEWANDVLARVPGIGHGAMVARSSGVGSVDPETRGPSKVTGVTHDHFFCVGAAKTGTTILARLLDQQPTVACMWEGYLLQPRHQSSVLNPDSQAWLKHGLSEAKVRDWHRRATEERSHNGELVMGIRVPSVARAIITEVLEDFGRPFRAEIVGDKWPYYHKWMPSMAKAFPDAKYIYNVRDPRATWNSGQTFKQRGRGDAILADMLKSERAVRRRLNPDNVLTMRYEDLIISPAETMSRIAGFLGFDFASEHLAYDPALDPLPDRWNWVPESKGELDRGLAERWRQQMPEAEQRRISEECADFIQRHGYEPL